MIRSALIAATLATLWAIPAYATQDDAEIQHLLSAIGSSGCTFTRNGTDHPAQAAEDHLRMKYRHAGSRIGTAEAFIERLASESSWTGQPYLIHCGADQPVPSGDWLGNRLSEFRETRSG
jgi:hypothetical protein